MEKETLLQMYRMMYISRTFEEHAVLLNQEKKIIGSIHAGEGEEAMGVGIGFAMGENDILAPSYRDVSAVLSRGASLVEIAGLLFGKSCGMSHGKTRILHVGDLDRGILPGNPILGVSSAIGIGAALASKKDKTKRVVVNIMGDGAANEGAVHEAMNFAAVQQLPIVFVIVNNGYAWSTPVTKHSHVPILANRALAYGMEGVVVDGNDVLAVYDTVHNYIEKAREGEGPALIEVRTYRWSGHSGNDKNVYRSEEERLWHYQNDPLLRMRGYLLALNICKEHDVKVLEEDWYNEVLNAYAYAAQDQDPLPDEIFCESQMLYMEGGDTL